MNRAADIFAAWTTYEKVVRGDYMHHREFFQALGDEVEARLEEPLSMLDLGCGDAYPVMPLFERIDVKRYVGIDESDAALRNASRRLEAANVSYELRTGSLPAALQGLRDNVNLVLGSYALHHLASSEKQQLLCECRRLLRSGGLLAVVDVFLEPNESRDDYRVRWEANARKAFKTLTALELDELIDHVRDADIPESVAGYEAMARAAGFAGCEVIREDRERLNKLVVFA